MRCRWIRLRIRLRIGLGIGFGPGTGLAVGLCLLAPPAHAQSLIQQTVFYSPKGIKLVVPAPAQAALDRIGPAALLPVVRMQPIQRRQQTLCLALALYHEARGQSDAERIAVAQVIFNRSMASGTSLCEVIWADHGSQFQWVKQGVPAILPVESSAWRSIQTLAMQLLQRRPRDLTQGATHFFNPDLCDPAWAHGGTVTARFTQVFMRLQATLPSRR
jgi:N-acetylmuramoyl-L-alanine amidase